MNKIYPTWEELDSQAKKWFYSAESYERYVNKCQKDKEKEQLKAAAISSRLQELHNLGKEILDEKGPDAIFSYTSSEWAERKEENSPKAGNENLKLKAAQVSKYNETILIP